MVFYSFRQKDDVDSSQRTRIVVQKSHSFRWRHLLCAWPFHFVTALALTALLCVLLVFSHPGSLASHYEEVYLPDPSPGLVTNMILYGTDWDVSTWRVGKGSQIFRTTFNKFVFKQLRNQGFQ